MAEQGIARGGVATEKYEHERDRYPIRFGGQKITSEPPLLGHDRVKSFDPQYRESTKPRYAVRVWNTLASREAGGGLALTLKLSQLVTEACCFIAVFSSLDLVLHRADAAYGAKKFADSIGFALVHVFELVDEIVLVQGVGLHSVNAMLKVLDVRPAMSLIDGRIIASRSGILNGPIFLKISR